MPIYEYRCQKCGETYEQLRRLADADRDLECPECKSREVLRLISSFAAGGGCGAGSGSRFT